MLEVVMWPTVSKDVDYYPYSPPVSLQITFHMGFFSAEKPQLRVAICTIAEDLYNNFEDANLLRMAKDKGYFGFRTEEDEVPAPHSCAVNCWKWMWLPRPS